GSAASDALHVTAFQGDEGIGELFDFRINLCSESADDVSEESLGQAACLAIHADAGVRHVHGIIRSIERLGVGIRWHHFQVHLVPRVWLLTQRVLCRVFEPSRCADMTVPGILREVLADAGLPDSSVRFALGREYEPREFVVQYRESDFAFISRLMEEE